MSQRAKRPRSDRHLVDLVGGMKAIRRPWRPGALRALLRTLRGPARLLTHLKMGSSLRNPRFRTGRQGRRPAGPRPGPHPTATVHFCDHRRVTKLRETVDIKAPSSRVWAVVQEDAVHAPRWSSNVARIEKLEVEQTTYSKPKRCAGKFIRGPLKGTWSYTYSENKAGTTHVVYEMDYELGGLLRFAGGLLAGQYAAGIRKNMEALKKYVESGKGPKPKE